MKRVFKTVIVAMVVLMSTCMFACGKNSKMPNVNPQISFGDELYFTTNQTLSEVSISLCNNDTSGKIGWIDPNEYIRIGLNEYEWKFVPTNNKYKTITGKTEILGYKIVNYTGINDIKLAHTGQDLKEEIVTNIANKYGADCVVAIGDNYNSSIVENGEYSVSIKLTAKQYRLIKLLNEPTHEVEVNVKVIVGKALPSISNIVDTIYNGKSQKPNVIVPNLVEGVDYTLTYSYSAKENGFEYLPLNEEENNFVNAGSYKILIEGKGEYFGKIEKQYTIKKMAFNKNIENVEDVDYTGASQKPDIAINGMVENVDYVLSYYYRTDDSTEFETLDRNTNDFVKVGQYKIVATPSANYVGGEVSTIYTIKAVELPNFSFNQELVYNGENQSPSIEITGLTSGVDFVVASYEYSSLENDDFVLIQSDNLKNAGKYRVTIKGIDNYMGQKSAVYIIERQELPVINGFYNVVYDGKSHKPNIVIDGLIFGVDYGVQYSYTADTLVDKSIDISDDESNFVDAGCYTVLVYGIGNYSRYSESIFRITKATNEFTQFVVTGWVYGEQPVEVVAVAKVGVPTVKFYIDSALSEEIEKPNINTNAGTYYVKAFVSVKNYNDLESETKQLVISQTTASVDSAESLADANPNGNYSAIKIVSNIELNSDLTFEKPVEICETAILTVGANVVFEDLAINGRLIAKNIADITINALKITNGNIDNDGAISCKVGDIATFDKVVDVCNTIVLSDNIENTTPVSKTISSGKHNIDLNGHNISNIKFVIDAQINDVIVTIGNSATNKSNINNDNAVFELVGNNFDLTLNNLCLNSVTNSAIIANKEFFNSALKINNCNISAKNGYAALSFKASYTYTITNSNISGSVAILLFAGELNLIDSTVVATGSFGEAINGETSLSCTDNAIFVLNYGYAGITANLTNITCSTGFVHYTELDTFMTTNINFKSLSSADELLEKYGCAIISTELCVVTYG